MSNLTYSSEYHTPVLVAEVLEYLAVKPGGRYLDATLGGGGHTQAILDLSAPTGQVVSIDRDPEAHEQARQRLSGYQGRFELVLGNYRDARDLVEGQFDGMLLDAGVSSHQLDEATRGFSFREEGPLDMRMGPDAPRLDEWLGVVDEEELANALFHYGEIKASRRLAAAIKMDFAAGKLKSTQDLAQMCQRVLGGSGARRKTQIHPATLVFQALRIALNDELRGLERAVASIPDLVKPGGRAVLISFHSLEDRIVKQGFKELAGENEEVDPVLRKLGMEKSKPEKVKILTRRPVEAGSDEVAANPRSRSAKLRAVEVL